MLHIVEIGYHLSWAVACHALWRWSRGTLAPDPARPGAARAGIERLWMWGTMSALSGLGTLLTVMGGFLGIPDWTIFGTARLLCWWALFWLPVLALLLSTGPDPAARRGRRWAGGLAVFAAALALYAFVIEPNRLQVNHHRIVDARLTEPVRVVLLADFQTDRSGWREHRALALALEAEPDLVLGAGDYLQEHNKWRFDRLVEELQPAMRALAEEAELGMFVVPGDVDPAFWWEFFEGTGARLLEGGERIELGPLLLTGMAAHESRGAAPPIEPAEQFHIALGHAPDFALHQPPADLLLAGHTHGGQIQVPIIGPLVTLSRVPRDWAGGGLVELPWGGHLIVSRGIGMERHLAPRLRVLCPPELVVIDLLPAA